MVSKFLAKVAFDHHAKRQVGMHSRFRAHPTIEQQSPPNDPEVARIFVEKTFAMELFDKPMRAHDGAISVSGQVRGIAALLAGGGKTVDYTHRDIGRVTHSKCN